METFQQRMVRLMTEYSTRVWPGLPVTVPTEDWEFDVVEIQAEGYANAHVDGEHEAWNICPYKSPQECGEHMAAEAYVETH